MALRDRIKKASIEARPRKRITLPITKEEVEVRSLGTGDKSAYQDEVFQVSADDQGKGTATVKTGAGVLILVAGGTFDPETGSKVFNGRSDPALLDLPTQDSEAIAEAVEVLSGLKAGAEKGAEGNFDASPASTTDSSSPASSE